MAGDKQLAKGDNNTQIIGNGNIKADQLAFIVQAERPLTQTVAYSLLQIVYDASQAPESEFTFEDPALMQEKLRFNNAPKYRAYIDNHSADYACVSEVMKDFNDSQLIIRKLRDEFIRVTSKFDENGNPLVGNGDEQLERIKAKLIEEITDDPRFDASKYPTELVEGFCIGLIACGVQKCKILVRPD